MGLFDFLKDVGETILHEAEKEATKRQEFRERGTGRNVVIASCPGQAEEAAGMPFAGQTKSTYEEFAGQMGPEWGRGSAHILEATERVEYRKKTGRTEATPAEVRQPENLARLASQIPADADNIVALGKNAGIAVDALREAGMLPESARTATSRHIGFQGLNQIREDTEGRPLIPGEPGNTQKRVEVVVKEVRHQLDGQ